MKVVLISDTHLLHDFPLPKGDILIHAGDMLSYGTNPELQQFAKWFGELPYKHKIVIAGNHDWPLQRETRIARETLTSYPNVIYLQDDETVVEGLRIYGSPWQPEFCGWAFNLPRDGWELENTWALIPEGLDILVTHGPPHGILDLNYYGEACGCKLLLDAVREKKPKLHAFGHIHPGHGTCHVDGTTFVNASICNERYEPVNPPRVIEL